jgi:hypothetical protein
MPRTSVKTKSEEEVVKRAPRRTVSRAPRKTATKKAVSTETTAPARRKAPTRIFEEEVKTKKPKREKSLYVSGVLFSLGLLAAAFMGYSDEGQINPSVVIAERNARLSAGVGDAAGETAGQASQIIPVQNTPTVPNGGLVPSKSRPEVAPVVEEVATTSASSTSDTASTTDDGLSEESEEVPVEETVSEDTTDVSETPSEQSDSDTVDGESVAQ